MIILDIRVPSLPAAVLDGHSQCANALAWAPHSSCHICTAGDDNQALIWDLSNLGQKQISDPILAYYAESEVRLFFRDVFFLPRLFFVARKPPRALADAFRSRMWLAR